MMNNDHAAAQIIAGRLGQIALDLVTAIAGEGDRLSRHGPEHVVNRAFFQ